MVLVNDMLLLCDLWSLEIRKIPVDSRSQFLELHKNCFVLSGYRKDIIIVSPGGKILKKLTAKHMIHNIKVSSDSNRIVVYDQKNTISCMDMDGTPKWNVDDIFEITDISVSCDGKTGYLLGAGELFSFDVYGEAFYEFSVNNPVKYYRMSSNGKYILILDIENNLTLYEQTRAIWEMRLKNPVFQMDISENRGFFIVVDSDLVLTCFDIVSSEKTYNQYLELDEKKRILDMEPLWNLSPGMHMPVRELCCLNVNISTGIIALTGLDGRIYFVRETGIRCMDMTFPGIVEVMGSGDSGTYAYVYGQNQITIVDLINKATRFIIFEEKISGGPVVNFYHERIYTISGNNTLCQYDFSGRLTHATEFETKNMRCLSCEEHGLILYGGVEITGLTKQGKVYFRLSVSGEIEVLFYGNHKVLGFTKTGSLISVDMIHLKAKAKPIKGALNPLKMLSSEPLLIMDDNKTLFHMNSDLSFISKSDSKDIYSIFFKENNEIFELVKKGNSIFCYDEIGKMVWRYNTNDEIREWALSPHGLVLLTPGQLRFLELKKTGDDIKHFSQFLEI